MPKVILSGPSGDAQWGKLTFEAAGMRSQSFKFLPDVTNDKLEASGVRPVGYLLPDKAHLTVDESGSPVFSLTLILSRQPLPHEESIEPLIEQAVLSFDVDLSISPAVLEQLGRRDSIEYRPLLVRYEEFTLKMEGSNLPIATAQAVGIETRVTLSSNLNREQAVAVLLALNGQPCAIQLNTTVNYVVVHESMGVHLYGSWAKIHDFLSIHLEDSSDFDGNTIKECFDNMLYEQILTVKNDSNELLHDVDANRIFSMFIRLASVVLTRLTPELHIDDTENHYALRARPHEMFHLDIRETLPNTDEAQIVFGVDLSEVLEKRLPTGEFDRYVHLVVLNASADLSTVNRRVKVYSQSRTHRQATSEPVKMIAINRQLQSVALSIAPSKHIATSLLSNCLFRPKVAYRSIRTWLIDNFFSEKIIESLPLVDNTNAIMWRDRMNQDLYWYLPSFSILMPSPVQNPDTSPFLFEYQTIGVTADGKPSLRATIHIDIKMAQSTAVTSELLRLGNPKACMVDIQSWVLFLEIPFVDEHGATQSHAFPATVSRQGDTLIATVELLNDWVRLCYGSISTEGFQSQPARIQINYAFPAYMPFNDSDIQVVFGGKQAMIPIIYSPVELNETHETVYLDAIKANLCTPACVMTMKRESQVEQIVSEHLTPTTISKPISRSVVAAASKPLGIINASVIVRPQLATVFPSLINHTIKYLRGSVACHENIDVFYDCRTLGVFYREIGINGTQSIGCRDALKLGQILYRQYEEMTGIRQAAYRVFRSLQQPGRFLVLPTQYSITRFEPNQDSAYRPCAILYSLIDAVDTNNCRIVFEATLQPDIAPYELIALKANLTHYAQDPLLEFPTEVMSDAEYDWAISNSLLTPTVVEMVDSLRITVSSNLTGGIFLQNMLTTAGIFCSVKFKLPDGSYLPSSLNLDLKRIIGPWNYGPLAVKVIQGNVQITNLIEQPVTVIALNRYSGGVLIDHLILGTTLSEGQAMLTAVDKTDGDWYAEYVQQRGIATTLQESRIFVEDVSTNVIFFIEISYTNHNLKELLIQVRLKDANEIQQVPLNGDSPIRTVNLVLPITDYLDKHLIQFQVTKQFNDDTQTTTTWIDWDLQQKGNLVHLNWNMISG